MYLPAFGKTSFNKVNKNIPSDIKSGSINYCYFNFLSEVAKND